MADFDFDHIEEWGPRLRETLRDCVPVDIATRISVANPEDTWDAWQALEAATADQRAMIVAVVRWLRSQSIIAYHGSRLDLEEIKAVRKQGLRQLRPKERGPRLRSILEQHPEWPKVGAGLDSAISLFARGPHGNREAQVHLTLSRGGLLRGFNHYLVEGSEFDRQVAVKLLDQEGRNMLARRGVATLFRLRVPGSSAMRALNPWLSLSRDCPNPVRSVLGAWSYWLAHSGFSSADLQLDCGLIFRRDLPADWIIDVEMVDDAMLRKAYRS